MVDIAQLKSWQPGTLDTVADQLTKERKALVDLQDEWDAGTPPGEWQGEDAAAARRQHTALYDRLVDSVAEITAVVNALDTAYADIKAAKDSLESALSIASRSGFAVDEKTGEISDTNTYDGDDPRPEQHAQIRVNNLADQISTALTDAASADTTLAGVLNTAAVGAYDVDGTLDNALNADDLRGKTPDQLADWLLAHPDEGADMLPALSPEVKQALGIHLANLADDIHDPNKPIDTAWLTNLNTVMDAYGQDPTVATAFANKLGPEGMLKLNGQFALLQYDDDFPDNDDYSRLDKDMAWQIGALQRNFGELLSAATQELTGDGQPGSATHLSSQWVQDFVKAGEHELPLKVWRGGGLVDHKVWGFQAMAPMLRSVDSHYLLTEAGDGMINFETSFAKEHHYSPWRHIFQDEDGRLNGGRLDSVDQSWYSDGMRLDWTTGTGDGDPAGWDPMGGLLDGLDNNPDAARDFFTGADVPVDFRDGDDYRSHDESRLDYLLTDRTWLDDHASWGGYAGDEKAGPTGVSELGDALQAATMDDPSDQVSRDQVREILEESVHAIAHDEAVSGHENLEPGADDTLPFSDMDWINPELRDPLANILGHHVETLHGTFESDGGPTGPYGVDWDTDDLTKVLADLGKDPTANETIRRAEYAQAIHEMKTRMDGYPYPGVVAENASEAMGKILGSLDYGAVRSDIQEATSADTEHNEGVTNKADLARDIVGLIPTGKSPIVGALADAGFEALISSWEKANQVDHIGETNANVGELLNDRRGMSEELVREIIQSYVTDPELVIKASNDAGQGYQEGYEWASGTLEAVKPQ